MSRRISNKTVASQVVEKVSKPLGEDCKNGGFMVKFHLGYTARSMIQFVKECSQNFRIKAHPGGIEISERIEDSSYMIKVTAGICHLKSYLYLSESPELTVGIFSSEIWAEIKGASKVGPAIMSKACGSSKLEIQIDDKGHNITTCDLRGCSNEKVCFPSQIKNEEQAVHFSLKELSKVCSVFKQKQAPYTLTVYQTYVTLGAKKNHGEDSHPRVLGETEIPLTRLCGIEPSEAVEKISRGELISSLSITHPHVVSNTDSEEYENCDEEEKEFNENQVEDQEPIISVTLDQKLIKAISKLSGSESGVVKVLAEKDKPVHMFFDIPNLGRFDIYIAKD